MSKRKKGAPGGPQGPLGAVLAGGKRPPHDRAGGETGGARERSDGWTLGRQEQSGLCDDEEYELGRYRKKVEDDGKELKRLRELVEMAGAENRITHMAANALLARVALSYGKVEMDPDSPGVALGWSLTMPVYDVEETVNRYEVHARQDEATGSFVVGVTEREN